MKLHRTHCKTIAIQQLRVPHELYIEVSKRLNDGESVRDGILRMLKENITGERIITVHQTVAPIIQPVTEKPKRIKAIKTRPPSDSELRADSVVASIIKGRDVVVMQDLMSELQSHFAPGVPILSIMAYVSRGLRRAGWGKCRMPANENGSRPWGYRPLWSARI